jgi:tyrosine-protein kinase Etk/Wzc
MNDMSRMEQPMNEEDEINLLDLFLVLLKRKWLIISIVLLAIAISVTISLLLPLKYTATARILPPKEPSTGISGLLSGAGSAFGGLAGSLLGGQSSADLYVGILESRSVADRLVTDFKLQKVYDKEYLEDTYKELANNTNIDVSRKTQVISVAVEDRDPKRAAAMANTYLDALDHINRTVNISEGHRKRVFLEKRLKKVKVDLIDAESALEIFEKKYGLVSIDDQAKAAIEGAAKIKGEIIAAQTELEVLKKFGTERQNEAVMLKAKIAELKDQLGRIERGNPSTNKNDSDEFFIPFNQIPELGMRLARLMREAKIQEEVFQLITTQYEMAKIEEAKDMDTIQVLDRAVPPDKKSSPKRALIVILSTIVAFFLAIFLSFFLEYLARVKSEDPERYQQMSQAMKLRKNK